MRYPEMVKTNARYRGPRESRKQSDAIRDIAHSIDKARGEFIKRIEEREQLFAKMVLQMNYDIPTACDAIMNDIKTVKGGESK